MGMMGLGTGVGEVRRLSERSPLFTSAGTAKRYGENASSGMDSTLDRSYRAVVPNSPLLAARPLGGARVTDPVLEPDRYSAGGSGGPDAAEHQATAGVDGQTGDDQVRCGNEQAALERCAGVAEA